MILSCNSCEKKFVVPDNAISASGRMVQCSSCGNKWKQFPIKKTVQTKERPKPVETAIKKPKTTIKTSKKKKNKKFGPDLYSPEYLAKKHGIKISSEVSPKKQKNIENKVKFGFYASLFVYTIILVSFLRLLYFTEDIIINRIPNSEMYFNYLFEALRNVKDTILNLLY